MIKNCFTDPDDSRRIDRYSCMTIIYLFLPPGMFNIAKTFLYSRHIELGLTFLQCVMTAMSKSLPLIENDKGKIMGEIKIAI